MIWMLLALQQIEPVEVEGQPLAANIERLSQALDFLGAPLPAAVQAALKEAGQDAAKLQRALDPRVLLVVSINPESRVKVARGPAEAVLQQSGWTTVLVKVVNDSPVKSALAVSSPQSGPLMTGGFQNPKGGPGRFLQVEMFKAPPMTSGLSGLKVEYALALVYSTEAGKREATIGFDVGQGTQDLGFRAETPVLFDVRPAIAVKLIAKDVDGKPTTARYTFTDKAGRVYPPQPKRLAPDFFFQKQIYRHSGDVVLLPPGELSMAYGRGPEYKLKTKTVAVPGEGAPVVEVQLERWIDPMTFGFYSGDHHIHAAGCQHYTSPTEGVHAADMFLHVKGEGLNVGCNLTWGPCFDYQRQFFEAGANKLSEPFTVLKYDIEVSGFGSQALGHVNLLNLTDQTYPGSEGTKTKGWPTWTTPLMKWAKKQGAYTGYAHSANGLAIRNDAATAKRLSDEMDANKDGKRAREEAAKVLLPEDFATTDADADGSLSDEELSRSVGRVKGKLPNLVIPDMDGIGAQELPVTAIQGICDFISAMDTQRHQEWNIWYHIMNCGIPLKASGETDFPCISGGRVGEGRVYVQMGKIDRIDYAAWCEGLAKGRSYVSDGYGHALEFSVGGKVPGQELLLDRGGEVLVKAKVAFTRDGVLGAAPGGFIPQGGRRTIDLIVNGQVAATKEISADDQIKELAFQVKVERSSWIALRQYPQLHTNPVTVLVDLKPVRASRRSALWCVGVIQQLWRVREKAIAEPERAEAKKTFEWAIEQYKKIAAESPKGASVLALLLLAAQDVEGQPLAANAARVVQAFELLGAPLAVDLAAAGEDPRKIQAALDARTSFRVTLGGAAEASPLKLQQAGWTPLLVKVVNPKGVREPLAFSSPRSGPVYAGVAALSMKRQDQPALRENENVRGDDRFLEVEAFTGAPMTPRLSGLGVEYAVVLVYCSTSGAREAEFSIGGAAVKAAVDALPAVAVKVGVRDVDGAPTTGRFTFRDKAGRVYPPQPKRLAPDFFFQKQVYRAHGGTVLLPPGVFTMEASRGPEYRTLTREIAVPGEIDVRLERWVDPGARGFWSGDHHIHAAGCAHYTTPTEGVRPADMFLQVKGEGLNVGCVLTWGPSFDYQHKFFSPGADPLSEPFTALKYDVEVSGFGSQALGHVCLLNLKEQIYPGARGAKGWPTWTTPVLKWAKSQGAVTGYAHSASGLQVDAPSAAKRLMEELDADRDGLLTPAEAEKGLMPTAVAGALTEKALAAAVDRAADELPNLVIPEMNSVGAMEMFVTVAHGLCDFMSAMDTARIPEWNAWYHVLNCGFPLKVSGETDFPCMSSTRVGQGRVYVRLGRVDKIDYGAWCEGIRAGRSYVSDGYAHALEFAVEGKRPGETLALEKPGRVKVSAVVAFGAETPAETPYGGLLPLQGRRWIGDTVDLRREGALRPMDRRTVELIVNGRAVASRTVPADGREHALELEAEVERSSWIALRQFPQLHTNPVDVIVAGRPIRASRDSALWCEAAIRRLWSVRKGNIAPAERDAADLAFRAACDMYRKIKNECGVQ